MHSQASLILDDNNNSNNESKVVILENESRSNGTKNIREEKRTLMGPQILRPPIMKHIDSSSSSSLFGFVRLEINELSLLNLFLFSSHSNIELKN